MSDAKSISVACATVASGCAAWGFGVILKDSPYWTGVSAILIAVLVALIALWFLFKPKPRVETYIGLDRAIRYIGFDSFWCIGKSTDEQFFSVSLAERLKEKIGRGDIKTFGRRYDLHNGNPPQARPISTSITVSEWDSAEIDAFRALRQEKRAVGGVLYDDIIKISDGVGWYQVELDKIGLETSFPQPRRGLHKILYGK